MTNSFIKHYLEDAISQFRKTKLLAERALAQVSDEEFFTVIDRESNSLAILVKHVAGNLRSRWTDFLTSDGEKEWRQRDTEFVVAARGETDDETIDEAITDSRESLRQRWEEGWQTLFDALAPLAEEDFHKTVAIRGEPHTIVQAINRQLAHYAYHAGQIVFLAKHLKSSSASASWKTLSVPRGASEAFRRQMLETSGDQPAPAEGRES